MLKIDYGSKWEKVGDIALFGLVWVLILYAREVSIYVFEVGDTKSDLEVLKRAFYGIK